ncbi:hypothetical protein EDD22DRAFT_306684 [Suillus occidentalis]|nr:hypothetical protein EDD22DRAFT_306684 [Suillus occidentalis]
MCLLATVRCLCSPPRHHSAAHLFKCIMVRRISGAMPQDGPCSIRSIEGAVTPHAFTARPKGVHNFSIYASLQREQPKIALEISCRHRQRLTLSWCSSSRGLEARSNIRFHHALLATQALDGGISSTDTATKSLTPPTSLAHTHLSNMTFVSNDPSWWPYIDAQFFYTYWTAAASVVVAYDWALTIGQEVCRPYRQSS